ncbi:MAG: aldose 1-epimerase [Saprospiraceae bacterium]
MYQLRQTPFGTFTRYDIFNEETGNSFSIVPARGANVIDIVFRNQSILDGYADPESLEKGKWGKSSVLFPFPNRLAGGSYNWPKKPYQFPINNAATGNAIHGFVRDMPFDVEYFFLAEHGASIRCYCNYDGRFDYFPFPFVLELEFAISDDGQFQVEVVVENTGNSSFPFGFGWHPYFRLTEKAGDHKMKLPPSEWVVIDDRMIPTGDRLEFVDFKQNKLLGNTVLDTCFAAKSTKGSPKLSLEAADRKITLKAPAKDFPFFQVFTPPHGESVALEPMTCNVDAFNNKQGLQSLQPKQRWKSRFKITVSG